jgi:DNA-binding response OmpR family regulator
MNIKATQVRILCEFDIALCSAAPVSVAIIDLTGFDESIWDCCKKLRKKSIPLLIISPGNNQKALWAGYEHGASGVLKKPVQMHELANYIRSLIDQES